MCGCPSPGYTARNIKSEKTKGGRTSDVNESKEDRSGCQRLPFEQECSRLGTWMMIESIPRHFGSYFKGYTRCRIDSYFTQILLVSYTASAESTFLFFSARGNLLRTVGKILDPFCRYLEDP